LGLLGSGRIIATGRPEGICDAAFHAWHLEPLDERRVVEILRNTSAHSAVMDARVRDLLRQPLTLVLHLLLQATSDGSAGTLLAAFQRHVARSLPQPELLLTALSA